MNDTMCKTRKWLAAMAAAIIIGGLSSCATKQSAVSKLERFSYELRDNGRYYTVEDWQKATDKFVKINRRIHKYDYTAAERARIGVLEGNCAKYMAQGVKGGVTDGVFGIGSEVQGILDGMGIKLPGAKKEDNTDL